MFESELNMTLTEKKNIWAPFHLGTNPYHSEMPVPKLLSHFIFDVVH